MPAARMACPRSGLAAVEDRDGGAAGEPPTDAEADDARANDRDARPLSNGADGRLGQRGSLRWNDPDRFDGFDLKPRFCAAPWPMLQ